MFNRHCKFTRATHNAKPRENEIDDVVHRFYHQHHFAAKAMAGAHDLSNMSDSIGGREEGSIKPSPSLPNELRESIWHVCFSDSAFNVLEYPGKDWFGAR